MSRDNRDRKRDNRDRNRDKDKLISKWRDNNKWSKIRCK